MADWRNMTIKEACLWVWWAMRRFVWMFDPRRAQCCDDLACKCATCTTEGCECWEARRG